MQLKLIEMEQRRLEEKKQKVRSLLDLLDYSGTKKWSTIFSTIKGNQSDKTKLRAHYFSDDEQKIINQLPRIGQKSGDVWIQLMKEIRQAIHDEVQPEDERAQRLVEQWGRLTYEMFKGDHELAYKTWNLARGQESEMGFAPISDEVIHFIEKAATVYRGKQNE